MAGANMAGIVDVFGDDSKQRIKSCEFHFKDHCNKMSKKLDPESSEVFMTLCNSLLESTTSSAYDDAKCKMDDFVKEKEERKFLASWISWWNDRRGFIFQAFAPKAAPQMNQAEVIHAGWAHRDLPNLSLLDACQADVRDAVTLDVEITAYKHGAASGGAGPSYCERQQKKHTEQLKRAKKLGKDMFPKLERIDSKSTQNRKSTTKKEATKQKKKPGKYNSRKSNNSCSRVNQSIQHAFSTCPSPKYGVQFSSSLGLEHTLFIIPDANNHSGMSLHPYELVPLPPRAQKCYGCGNMFTDEYRSPPHNCNIW